jgi:hypothetical protein
MANNVLTTDAPVGTCYQITPDNVHQIPVVVRAPVSPLPANLQNLSNTRFVDNGTVVPPGARNGNIESPFGNLTDGVAGSAAGDVLLCTEGDYTPEGGILITQNSLIGVWGPSIGAAIAVDTFTVPNPVNLILQQVNARNVIMAAGAALAPRDGTFQGIIGSGAVYALECTFLNAFSVSTLEARDCTFVTNIRISGTVCDLIDCQFFGPPPSITFTGAAGTVRMDGASYDRWIRIGGTVLNGSIDIINATAKLSNIWHVDGGTTVPTAGQDATIANPFATLEQARIAIQTTAPASAVIKMTPGTYAAMSTGLPDLPVTIQNLASQDSPAPCSLILPALSASKALLLEGATESSSINSTSSLTLRGCDITGATPGPYDCTGIIDARDSVLPACTSAAACAFDCCVLSDNITAVGSVTMKDCQFAKAITLAFTGPPGVLYQDGETYSRWLTAGCVLSNGTLTVVNALNQLQTDLDANGFAITNYANIASAADLALSTDALTSFPAFTFTGKYALGISKKYQAELHFEVGIDTDADHAVNGAITWTVQCSIITNGAGVATVSFNTVSVPNISYLPAGLAGSTADVAASANGFTIKAQRPSGIACHAWFYGYWVRIKDVT